MKAALSLSTLATLALLTRTTFAAPASPKGIVGYARDDSATGMLIPPRDLDDGPTEVSVYDDTESDSGDDQPLEKRQAEELVEVALEGIVDIVNGILSGIAEDKEVRIC